ncbi:hypothetical protein EYC84_004631 [Monilinia fructicola]|uniref:37S ribosomal protein mrp10, mitochondrial n=1 Tax=Monilinia fructicola TaxID=38448 RepID=A0A5M9K101_MONFR|nr:hypothetical protein EYC84_004631 [Monilinia fructicola]
MLIFVTTPQTLSPKLFTLISAAAQVRASPSSPPQPRIAPRTPTSHPPTPFAKHPPPPPHQIAMPPKGASTAKVPMRLPPLPKLRVRRPNQTDANPCLAIMTSVLTCWASSGYNVAGCQALETQLRTCMDAPKAAAQKKNTINYHLSRMYPKIVGPRKKK